MMGIRHGRRMMGKVGAGFIVWAAACLAASYAMMSYDFRPGQLGTARTSWPVDSSLPRTPAHTTVVAFLHPRCVCSKATVNQLIRTVQRHPEVDVVVPVFVPPEPTADLSWERGAYVQTIRAALPSARVVFDAGGMEAQRFGAWTSGTILVYAPDGREVFRGGITNRRGGEDDNFGRQRLVRVLTASAEPLPAQGSPSPVFGCPIIKSGKEGGS